jgi:ComF family protein
MFREIFTDSLLTLFFPQECHVCGESVENQSDGVACQNCWQKTKFFSFEDLLCQKCGLFLSEKNKGFQTFCRLCEEDCYDLAKSCGVYEKALAVSVLRLKHLPQIPQNLQKIFLETFEVSSFYDSTKIMPVPLSPKRFFERGFNQAQVLADFLGQKTGLEVDGKSLQRKTHTIKNRAEMDKKARRETVKKSFEVVFPKLVQDQKILLIDDVFTTGATVSACAEVLKKSGAEKVYVLTLARPF